MGNNKEIHRKGKDKRCRIKRGCRICLTSKEKGVTKGERGTDRKGEEGIRNGWERNIYKNQA